MAKNAAIGDWILDYNAAKKIDTEFAESIKKYLEFMEGLVFKNYKEDIEGTPLIYAKLYILGTKLMHAPINNDESHILRVALLNLKPSLANNGKDIKSLTKLRNKVIILSRQFSDSNWKNIRTIGVISPLLLAYSECNLSTNDFKYSSDFQNIDNGMKELYKIMSNNIITDGID